MRKEQKFINRILKLIEYFERNKFHFSNRITFDVLISGISLRQIKAFTIYLIND